METLTIRDRIAMAADKGRTDMKLNLYKKQVQSLLNEGYSIQRLSPVPGYVSQFSYRISWKDASEGTPAYDMLAKAAEMFPDLLQYKESDDSSEPFPRPYSGGGWDDIT